MLKHEAFELRFQSVKNYSHVRRLQLCSPGVHLTIMGTYQEGRILDFSLIGKGLLLGDRKTNRLLKNRTLLLAVSAFHRDKDYKIHTCQEDGKCQETRILTLNPWRATIWVNRDLVKLQSTLNACSSICNWFIVIIPCSSCLAELSRERYHDQPPRFVNCSEFKQKLITVSRNRNISLKIKLKRLKYSHRHMSDLDIRFSG